MVNMILGTSWRDGDKLTNPGGWGPGKEGRPGIQIARHTPPKDVQKKITERNCFVLKSLFLYWEDKN